MNTPEKEIQTAILKAYATRDDWAARCRMWRSGVGVGVQGDIPSIVAACRRCGVPCRVATFGKPGQADLSGILSDGRRLEIEIKTAIGRQSKEQVIYQSVIERFGGIYILARSPEDVGRALAKHAML